MAFFESKSGFWLMFATFLIIATITFSLRIENIINYWHQITTFAGRKI